MSRVLEFAIKKQKDFMGRVSDARERLMGAMTELIWTGSYGSTTIDQICDKAGVKKGSFCARVMKATFCSIGSVCIQDMIQR